MSARAASILDAPGPSDAEGRKLPALGFLGTGWIGLNRLEAIAKSGAGEITAIAEPCADMATRAKAAAPDAALKSSLEDLLEERLDGLVIATPSALHAEQALAALDRGIAVFCQKPLGRTAAETRKVIDAARQADRLLGVDLSYRFISAIERVRELIQAGDLGQVYAVEMLFHNAYGPDKPWFYDRRLSGGGCVIDLGIHLVDLALWMLGFPRVQNVTSRLMTQGKPWNHQSDAVEDYASARLDLESGASINLTCSWRLPAGCDAVISGAFYGTSGGAGFHNVNGSFYEFAAARFRGTLREPLPSVSEEWGGRAAVAWVRALAESPRFDPRIETLSNVADTLDAIYAQNPK